MPKPHHTIPERPAALCFDCDGTVLLTAELHFTGMSVAAEKQGLHMPRDWYMSLTGLDRRALFKQFAADFGAEVDQQRLVADSIAATIALADNAKENPLVADLARACAGVLPLALVTNCEGAIAKAFLIATGLFDLFDSFIAVEDAPRSKPAPDLYLLAASRLGVAAEQCLVLEDSDQGIAAAKAARMRWHDVRAPDWAQNCLALRTQVQHALATESES